jgi:hypothetical protein
MNRSAISPSGQSAGWIVAAIVAVIAICAVSFMLSQRPRLAIAVAEGDPLMEEAARVAPSATKAAIPAPAASAIESAR